MAVDEETIKKLLVEIRMMEGSTNLISSRLRIVSSALEETAIAMNTLEGVKGRPKGTEVLVPVGAGSFLRAELTDVERAITGVGAGVCIEKSIESSTTDLKERQAELEKLSGSLRQQLEQLLASIENAKNNLSRMIEQQQRTPQRA